MLIGRPCLPPVTILPTSIRLAIADESSRSRRVSVRKVCSALVLVLKLKRLGVHMTLSSVPFVMPTANWRSTSLLSNTPIVLLTLWHRERQPCQCDGCFNAAEQLSTDPASAPLRTDFLNAGEVVASALTILRCRLMPSPGIGGGLSSIRERAERL